MTAKRLLFVHAHPDDESSKGAATAAKYVDEGHEVVLVTCTGGEAGDVLNPSHPPVEAMDLPGLRATELATAVAIIGFTRSYLLGYHDSGLPDDPDDIPPGTFASVDVDEPARDLAAILREERPHVVVTYPPDGGYPHPDHIAVYRVTMRAIDLAEKPDGDQSGWSVPRVVFGTGFPLERTEALHDALVLRGDLSPFEEWFERRMNRPRRDADVPPDVRVDVARWFHRRDDALRAHATQVDPAGEWFSIPRDLEAEVFPWETYVLVKGTPYPAGADDLFVGLEEEGE